MFRIKSSGSYLSSAKGQNVLSILKNGDTTNSKVVLGEAKRPVALEEVQVPLVRIWWVPVCSVPVIRWYRSIALRVKPSRSLISLLFFIHCTCYQKLLKHYGFKMKLNYWKYTMTWLFMIFHSTAGKLNEIIKK